MHELATSYSYCNSQTGSDWYHAKEQLTAGSATPMNIHNHIFYCQLAPLICIPKRSWLGNSYPMTTNLKSIDFSKELFLCSIRWCLKIINYRIHQDLFLKSDWHSLVNIVVVWVCVNGGERHNSFWLTFWAAYYFHFRNNYICHASLMTDQCNDRVLRGVWTFWPRCIFNFVINFVININSISLWHPSYFGHAFSLSIMSNRWKQFVEGFRSGRHAAGWGQAI